MDPDIEELLRDTLGEYHHAFSWCPANCGGTLVSFSKSCGEGCCSWRDDYFIDSSKDKRLLEYFEQNPSGDSYEG